MQKKLQNEIFSNWSTFSVTLFLRMSYVHMSIDNYSIIPLEYPALIQMRTSDI